MSWVARVTMKGCRLNLATKKPFTIPISAPMATTMRIVSRIQPGVMAGRLEKSFREMVRSCSSAPATAAVRPTTRPPDRSVPVRTIQPAIPSAMGSDAATRETMFAMEPADRKFLFLIAV